MGNLTPDLDNIICLQREIEWRIKVAVPWVIYGLDWTGLNWAGLNGLDWPWLGWTDCTGQHCNDVGWGGLGKADQSWAELCRAGMDFFSWLHWTHDWSWQHIQLDSRLDWTTLDWAWARKDWTGLGMALLDWADWLDWAGLDGKARVTGLNWTWLSCLLSHPSPF